METIKNNRAVVIRSKFRGFCKDCHFTIWQGENIEFDGSPHHIDCLRAIKDETPRVLNSHWEKILGKPNLKKLKSKIQTT